MSSKAIKERADDRSSAPGSWQPLRETAPSFLREDEPQFARIIGMIGLFFVVLTGLVFLFTLTGRGTWISVGYARMFFAGGLGCLLFHAASDKDMQVRRSYGFLGVLLLIASVVLSLIPAKGAVGSLFGYGFLCLVMALLFLMCFIRNETELQWREKAINLLGIAGVVAALVGLVGGTINQNLLIKQPDAWPPYGVLLALVGLAYLCAFIGLRGISDNLAYNTGLGIGGLGVLVFLVALLRSVFQTTPYLVPWALALMALGLLYGYISILICSDHPLVVIHRRELAAYFYSPVAHIVLIGFTVIAGVQFFMFVKTLERTVVPGAEPLVEPIVRRYVIDFFPIFTLIFIVPVLTMRLLSEERRTGTLEMLFTSPLQETPIVLGKFLAGLVFFLLAWMPWVCLLVALRVEGGQPFDYYPLFSFFVTLVFTGAAFVSMGLFFSSLTSNQIISAVLTFAGMLLLSSTYWIKFLVVRDRPGMSTGENPWVGLFTHVSYLDLWIKTLDGALVPKFLLFYLSLTIFWLFATVKVLEARRWT